LSWEEIKSAVSRYLKAINVNITVNKIMCFCIVIFISVRDLICVDDS